MTSETDAEFLDRLEATPRYNPAYRTLVSDRLFALARRGAAVQWRPIQEDYEGEVLLWPRGSAVPSHFMPLPPPPAGETSDE